MFEKLLDHPLENHFNKGGLRTSIIRRIRDYRQPIPDLLWSRGWFAHCDNYGDRSYLYPGYPTRYMVRSLRQLRGRYGVIWLRLGSYPINSNWGTDRLGDVATFSRDVVGHLGGPTVLVTTDGDMSVPAHLPPNVASNILSDPNIVAWFTQNYDGSIVHPKLFGLPIGLGLHAGSINRMSGVWGQAKIFQGALSRTLPTNQRILKLWSDVHLKLHPDHNGNPRGILNDAINWGSLSKYLDLPVTRLTQTELWDRYGQYAFVISLPGHGWDCYRTWEALALGAIVVTIHSPLDALLEPYRVIFLDGTKPNCWEILNDSNWIDRMWEQYSLKPVIDLRWSSWIEMVRSKLVRNDTFKT